MSAFGNDCHFFYTANCAKGASCPFRHSEAAKVSDIICTFWQQNRCMKPYCPFRHADIIPQQKNRSEIPCYWENQPMGCAKSSCPFKHLKPRPVTSETALPNKQDEHQVLPTDGNLIHSDQVKVHPVIVNIGEDSDVDMNSPVKRHPVQTQQVKTIPVQSEQVHVPKKLVQKKILQGKPIETAEVPKKVKTQVVKQPLTKQKIQKQNVTVQFKTSVKNRLKNTETSNVRILVKDRGQQNETSSKRLSVKDRLQKTDISGSRPSVKDRLGGSSPHRPSVKDRLHIQDKPDYSSDEGKRPVHKRISKPVITDSNVSDSDDGEVEIKSLEQIQREKALRSMGLKELKDGTLVKISEHEKTDNNSGSDDSDPDSDSQSEGEEEVEEKGEEEENSEQEEEEEEEEGEEEIEEEEEEEEEEGEEEEEVEEEEEEELEEPDIDIMEPETNIEFDEPEEIGDTRTAMIKDTEATRVAKKPVKKIIPISMDSKIKKRQIIMDDDEDPNKTPALKESLRNRLGKRVNVDDNIVIKVSSNPQGAVKRRLGLKEPVGSTNQGTVKTVAGIKTRLGWASSPQQEEEEEEEEEQEEEKVCVSPVPKRRGWRKQKTEAEEEAVSPKPKEISKKRRWRKVEKEVDQELSEEVDVGSEGSSSRPSTPVEEQKQEVDQVKKRRTEIKKEVDPGAMVQEAVTKKWRNLGVWSSRNPRSQQSRNEDLEKLGIKIIDLQGGKVVKMGKKDETAQESSKKKEDGDEWVKESMRRLAAKRDARKEKAIYVPPVKRSGSSLSQFESSPSPPKRKSFKSELQDDSDNDSMKDLKVKTFTEIMAAKKQRQKRSLEKAKSALERNERKISPLVDENSNDSVEIPFERIEEIVKGRPSKSEHKKSEHKKHKKERKKWRKKNKSKDEDNPEKKDLLTAEVENVSEKENNVQESATSVNNDSVFITKDDSNIPVEQDAKDVTDSKNVEEETSSPAKRIDHLLSDSWLEFDSEDLGVEDKNDDDLLKEIDELLA
ncbi:hypothetical protein FSP39_010142 [Pinctada imbricata]|uniref:C3H1-type domain-containing protein n=1 Tax=Pinctada imbricata TaxID=66713 RepID=A0AA88YBJ8_PINIB|nr:hypothetical protein FSP39_010142 [Pinctada imbricata]